MTAGFCRKPPMPVPRGAGWCRWCDLPIVHQPDHPKAGALNRRRMWHPGCAEAYKIACGWDEQRKAVYRRDRGYCAVCRRRGRKTIRGWIRLSSDVRGTARDLLVSRVRPIIRRDWHVDHVVPLWQVAREPALTERERFWGLSNLQTLCEQHHREKTTREAELRAAIRREATRLPTSGIVVEVPPGQPTTRADRSGEQPPDQQRLAVRGSGHSRIRPRPTELARSKESSPRVSLSSINRK